MRAHGNLLPWVGALCLVGLSARMAPAQAVYDFVTDNNNGNYTLLPNGPVTVPLFFRETLADSSIASPLLNLDGLFSSRAQVSRTTSPTSPARITAAAADMSSFDINDSSTPAEISASNGSQAIVGGIRFFEPSGTP